MYEQLLALRCDNRAAAAASGLPAAHYTDPAHFELEKRRIFYRSWICVGHECMAKPPGAWFVARVADQEVLVQRHVVAGRDGLMTQRLWHFWPNTAMGLYPIPDVGLVWCIRHMTPVRHDESLYHYRWFSDVGGPVDTIREYAAHHAETTGAEDAEVVAGVQRGMASLGFERARLFCTPSRGVSSEHVIKYFHDLVRTAMTAPA